MGRTVERKYQTDSGTIMKIRVSPDAHALAGNPNPAGAVTDLLLYAFASNPGSKRKKGVHARGIVIGREVGVAPNTFIRRTFVPISTKAALDAFAADAPISINGVAYTVKSKINEG